MFAAPASGFRRAIVAAQLFAAGLSFAPLQTARADAGEAVQVITSACLENMADLAGLDALAARHNWSKSEESINSLPKDLAITSMWDAEQNGEKLRIIAGLGRFEDGESANLCTVIFEKTKTDGIAFHKQIEASLGLEPVADMKLAQGRVGIYQIKTGRHFGLTLQIVWMNDGTPVQASVVGPRWRSA